MVYGKMVIYIVMVKTNAEIIQFYDYNRVYIWMDVSKRSLYLSLIWLLAHEESRKHFMILSVSEYFSCEIYDGIGEAVKHLKW